MKNLYTILIVLFAICNGIGQATPKLAWQFGTYGSDMAKGGLIIEDIDGNNLPDIISTSRYFESLGTIHDYITVSEYDAQNQTYDTKWISNIFSHEIHALELYDYDGDNVAELFVGLHNGRIEIIDLLTYERLESINIDFLEFVHPYDESKRIGAMSFRDINADNKMELIVSTKTNTYILNTSDFEIIDSIDHGARKAKVANIDSDDALEIVLSSGTILEYTTAGFTLEYNIPEINERTPILAIDIDSDGISEIVYSYRNEIFMYSYLNEELIWSRTYSNLEVDGLWQFDVDGDGIEDVLGGEIFDAPIYCYNGINGEFEFTIKDSSEEGVTNLWIADLDNDAAKEIIWAGGRNSDRPDHYFVYDLDSKQEEWQSIDFASWYGAFDIGDIDADGTEELLIGSVGIKSSHNDEIYLSVYDADSKELEWRNEDRLFANNDDRITFIKIANVDTDLQNEIIVGMSGGSFGSSVYVLDSPGNIKFNIPVPGMDLIMGVLVSDIDNDNRNEIIVSSGTNVGGSTHSDSYKNFIHVFDGQSGQLKWKTEQISGIYTKVGSLHIGNIDNDEAKEIVAVRFHSGNPNRDTSAALLIVDGSTQVLEKDFSRKYSAVTLADLDGDGKDELITAHDQGKVTVLDGVDRSVVEEYELDLNTISGLKIQDFDNDGNFDLILSDLQRIAIYDISNSALKWRSEIISLGAGLYNSLIVKENTNGELADLYIDVGHSLRYYLIDFAALIGPNDPINNPSFNIHPNPATTNLSIALTDLPAADLAIIDIYNISGHKIMQKEIDDPDDTINLNVSNLIGGNYILIVRMNGETYAQKLCIMK